MREKAEELEKSSFPIIEWTQQDVTQLKSVLANPTLIELFRMCAASPERFFCLTDTLARTGQSLPQARGALGGFTPFVRVRFSRNNWPIEAVWGQGGEQQMYYRMTPAVAGWWNEAPERQIDSATAAATHVPAE